MWNDTNEILKNFYGLPLPDEKHMKARMKKVAQIIEELGDKYCLAVPVEKKLNG